ncbi:hypothetical protein GA0074692_0297 [Micromonospora pallida]|uniref:Uncharacterized protein n=1 Tax=Micromonospora pallida TaxID=145854 RepID=A0A1C6RLC8_9ACTN|nr:hypothetical protein [Micromonospora pallida]SCL17977.1 hypothetical protein GA0074692_0297 [Micromonospora pallida]
MSERELYCDSCQGVQLFEVPPCADGHGADCPELVCTNCGAALLIATFRFGPARLARRPAPRGGYRHAA